MPSLKTFFQQQSLKKRFVPPPPPPLWMFCHHHWSCQAWPDTTLSMNDFVTSLPGHIGILLPCYLRSAIKIFSDFDSVAKLPLMSCHYIRKLSYGYLDLVQCKWNTQSLVPAPTLFCSDTWYTSLFSIRLIWKASYGVQTKMLRPNPSCQPRSRQVPRKTQFPWPATFTYTICSMFWKHIKACVSGYIELSFTPTLRRVTSTNE